MAATSRPTVSASSPSPSRRNESSTQRQPKMSTTTIRHTNATRRMSSSSSSRASTGGAAGEATAADMAVKARELLNLCCKGASLRSTSSSSSLPMGNLATGNLGAYYLLLEYADFLAAAATASSAVATEQSHPSKTTTRTTRHPRASGARRSGGAGVNSIKTMSTPRSQRLLHDALEASQKAVERLEDNKKRDSNHDDDDDDDEGEEGISLMGSDWMGANVLRVICDHRLQQEEKQLKTMRTAKKEKTTTTRTPPAGGNLSTTKATTTTPHYMKTTSARVGAARRTTTTQTTTASQKTTPRVTPTSRSSPSPSTTTTPKTIVTPSRPPPSTPSLAPTIDEQVTLILNRIQRAIQRCLQDENNKNQKNTNNNNVYTGRAGGLQAIFMLRRELDQPTLGQDEVVQLATQLLKVGRTTAVTVGMVESSHVCNDGSSQSSTNHPDDDNDDINDETKGLLFWLYDVEGTQMPYLGASRGIVGILHTLLGLSPEDWTIVEETIPQGRQWVRNSIDAYFIKTDSDNKAASTMDQSHFFNDSGHLRPILDSPSELNSTSVLVDMIPGESGLAILLLQAARVFDFKRYVIEAHRICDQVLLPWLLNTGSFSLASVHLISPSSSSAKTKTDTSMEERGLAGLAISAICFLQLSQCCFGLTTEIPKGDIDLARLWRERARKLVLYSYDAWIAHVGNVTGKTVVTNLISLYEGMGNAASVLWQLSLQMSSKSGKQVNLPTALARLPLYSSGYWDCQDSPSSTWLSSSDVILFQSNLPIQPAPPPAIKRSMKPTQLFGDSPQPTKGLSRPKPSPKSKEELERQRQEAEQKRSELEMKLTESRRRRAAADEEARKRKAQLALVEQEKLEEAKARRAEVEARRKADLERRKATQRQARLRAEQKAELDAKRKRAEAAKRREQDERRRQALLKARTQAQERVQAKRVVVDVHETKRCQAEAKKKSAAIEARKKAVEVEKKRRQNFLKARIQREAEQAEKARKLEAEEELKIEQHRQRRLEELKRLEAERKTKDLERKRKHDALLAQKKREEEAERANIAEEGKRKEEMALKRRQESHERQRAALKRQEAEENRRRDEVLARKKQVEEKRQKHVEEEVKEQTPKVRRQIKENEQSRRTSVASTPEQQLEPPKAVYSPSFLEKKKMVRRPHYAAPTKASNFWSLQTDADVGRSDHNAPDLVAESGHDKDKSCEKEGDTTHMQPQSAKKILVNGKGFLVAEEKERQATKNEGNQNCTTVDDAASPATNVIIDTPGDTVYTSATELASEADGSSTLASPDTDETGALRSRKAAKSQNRAEKWQKTRKGQEYTAKKANEKNEDDD